MKPFGTICFGVMKPKCNFLATTKEGNFWRKNCDAFVEQNTLPTLKHAGGSIMLWGCVAAGPQEILFEWKEEWIPLYINREVPPGKTDEGFGMATTVLRLLKHSVNARNISGLEVFCLCYWPWLFFSWSSWWLSRKSKSKIVRDTQPSIQWTLSKQLEDLNFADDVSLLPHKQQHAKLKITRLSVEAAKTGLKLCGLKTNRNFRSTYTERTSGHFTNLGSIVSKNGGSDDGAIWLRR